MKGQALTSLLIIMFVGLSIIATSAGILNTNVSSTARLLEANDAFTIAESGVEEALLRYLRDPLYIGGTIPFDLGTATISIGPTNPVTIISTGVAGSHTRSIKVTINNAGGITTVSSWKEQ